MARVPRSRRLIAAIGDAQRAPVVVFAIVEVVAFVLIVALGRNRWFFNDDWDFLAQRKIGNLGDLFRNHYDHWVTIPIVAYRFLWWSFGLHTYLPYQLLVVFAHLGVAALLRVVMRRAGAGPWFATAAAGLFALFGAGNQDLWQAFQVTFVGALLFGLVDLLLADHDGPIDGRDWLGLAAGLASLMFSLVGVVMVVAVGLATLARRGARVALFHTVPLAALFVVWWFSSGKHTGAGHTGIGQVLRFVGIGVSATFGAIGGAWGLGVVVAVGLIGGLWLAWSRLPDVELRRRAAMPVALVVAGLLFLLVTGYGRSEIGGAAVGAARARESRYLDVFAATTLPALAVAANALVRRWRVVAPVMLALLAISVASNVDKMVVQHQALGSTLGQYRRALLAVPRLPRIGKFPRVLQPEPHFTMGVTYGWLLDQRRAGKLSAPNPPLSPTEARTELLVLALSPVAGLAPPRTCRPVTAPMTARFPAGERVLVRGSARIVLVGASGPASAPITFGQRLFPGDSLTGTPARVLGGPIVVRITPTDRRRAASLCTAPPFSL